MNTNRSQHGFTIIETLVAITVLMIAIAGPLVVASKGLTSALASKDQMVASYLAQESMETIKNIRDNNEYIIDSGNPNGIVWEQNPSALPPAFLGDCYNLNSPDGACDASAVDSPELMVCPTAPSAAACPIYIEPGGNYGHASAGATPTAFTRYFYLTPGQSSSDVIITVVVDWREGSTPYEISLSSELVNSTR